MSMSSPSPCVQALSCCLKKLSCALTYAFNSVSTLDWGKKCDWFTWVEMRKHFVWLLTLLATVQHHHRLPVSQSIPLVLPAPIDRVTLVHWKDLNVLNPKIWLS